MVMLVYQRVFFFSKTNRDGLILVPMIMLDINVDTPSLGVKKMFSSKILRRIIPAPSRLGVEYGHFKCLKHHQNGNNLK